MAVLIGSLYASCLTSQSKDPSRRYAPETYYPLMAEGWLQGRLDIPREVPAGLLKLSNPYDPDANERYRFAGAAAGLHDLCLYQGRLYMYWGPTPTLIAFLPWRVITGHPLSTVWAVWGFALGGYLVSGWLLLRVVRNHFPSVSPILVTLGLGALGVCNWAPVVLRRPSVWEVPIAAAFCLGGIAWWCLGEALWAQRRKTLWLAAASLAYGLAVAARPTWIVGAVVLLIPLLPVWREWRERAFWRQTAAALVPLGLVVAGLLALNGLRFGNILEFGQRYQLGGTSVLDIKLFSPAYVPFNARIYLFSPPRFSCYFPFALFPLFTLPAGYVGTEMVYGLLVMQPFLWLGGLIFLGWRKYKLAGLSAILGVNFVALLAVLSLFGGATARYQLELAPPLALLAALGMLVWGQRVAGSWWRRWLVLGSSGAAIIVSGALTMAASFQVMEKFVSNESKLYQETVRRTDALTNKLGFSPSVVPESIELTLLLPRTAGSRIPEVLVSTGKIEAADGICILYPSLETIQLGFFHGEEIIATSAIMKADRSVPHRLRVELGSFYPLASHPFWARTQPKEAQNRTSTVRVTWNDVTVIDKQGPFHPPFSSRPNIGVFPRGGDPKFAFTGKVLRQQIEWFKPE